MALNLTSYATLSDGSTTVLVPYTSQSVEEDTTVIFADDGINPDSSTTNHSCGRVRYFGDIEFPLSVRLAIFLKDWIVTDWKVAMTRTLVIDNSLQKYTYASIFCNNWELSCNAEGFMSCRIGVMGYGSAANNYLRLEGTSTAYAYTEALANYDAIPWHKTRLYGTGNYVFDTSSVTTFNFSIGNNIQEIASGDDYLVNRRFDYSSPTASGSVTLYHATTIGKPGFSSPWATGLYVPSAIVSGDFGNPSLYLTFPRCVPTTYPDAGGSRRDWRTRTINFTCERTSGYGVVY